MKSLRAPTPFFVASVLAHAALAYELVRYEVPTPSEPVTITLTTFSPPPPPAPPPPPKPPEPPPKHLAPRPPAPPPPRVTHAAPPPPAAPAAPTPAQAVPDFGVQLSGGAGDGPGGIAVPAASAPPPAPVVHHAAAKVLAAAAPAAECADPPTKPRLIPPFPQPVFPAEARAAGIQGKVKVRITVDASGAIANVEIIAGLGHGCDESALEAARSAHFEPALHCGKPVTAPITMGFTF